MIETVYIITEQVLIHLPLMFASYISFSLLKVPDLSLESAYVAGAMYAACMLTYLSIQPAFPLLLFLMGISMCAGACVGITSGFLTRFLAIPHLLSAIITNGIFWGVNQLIVGTYLSLSNVQNPLIVPLIGRHPELPVLLIIGCLIIAILFIICHSQLGYSFAVFGSSPHFFKHYSINLDYVFIIGLCISNALAGLTGYLFAQSTGFADINMGLGKTLFCITALMLGKTVLSSKKPIMVSIPVVGGVLYFIMQQSLLKIGLNLKYFTAVQALFVLCILIIHTRKMKEPVDHLGV